MGVILMREVLQVLRDGQFHSGEALGVVLGVSRAHLYKVLDAGALPFTVVGNRDRRISMSDLRDYVAKAEELRRVTARSAAQTRQTRALAIDEL